MVLVSRNRQVDISKNIEMRERKLILVSVRYIGSLCIIIFHLSVDTVYLRITYIDGHICRFGLLD